MSSPGTRTGEAPHIVTLVLQSKKALHYGEQLCSRANSLSTEYTQCAVDVLALDAKVRWMSDVIRGQAKLAADVAKSIEQKRAVLQERAKEWDAQRDQRADALDKILESLGAQRVPPDFHQASSDSSIFGSQDSDDQDDQDGANLVLQRSPTVTIRADPRQRRKSRDDRSKWKTLRDFVDERAIEEVLESLENERTTLDDILATTADFPREIAEHASVITESLPETDFDDFVRTIIESQRRATTEMADRLTNLAHHYDQMSNALSDSEAGEVYSEEDIQEMNRDTDELPRIIAELEERFGSIETLYGQLQKAKTSAQGHLEGHQNTLEDLEQLGELMTEMLQRQMSVETDCSDCLAGLHGQLFKLETFHHQFTLFQYSYNKSLVEMARRRQYQEAADNIVRGMMAQLSAMTEEERLVREHFNAEHSSLLPLDICYFIENPPTKWKVIPWNEEPEEGLPVIDSDLLAEAKGKIAASGGGTSGSQSL